MLNKKLQIITRCNPVSNFFFRPTNAMPLILAKAFWALAAFINLCGYWYDRHQLFYQNSLVGWKEAPASSLFNAFDYVSTNTHVDALLIVALFSLCLFAFGIYSRLFGCVYYLILISCVQQLGVCVSGWDYLQVNMLVVFLISPSTPPLKIELVNNRPKISATRQKIPTYPYVLLQWQFAILFLSTTWFKVKSFAWRQGIESGHFLMGGYSNIQTNKLMQLEWLNYSLTMLTLAIELIIPFLLWRKETKVLGYFLLISLMATLATSKVFIYPLTIFALSIAFLSQNDLDKISQTKSKTFSQNFKIFAYATITGLASLFGIARQTNR